MRYFYYRLAGLSLAMLFKLSTISYGQAATTDSAAYYNSVKTFVNPVLPGDHPDPTLLKVGDDFYHCGSSFHFNPYLPVYHSKDLVHWEIISRVVPAKHSEKITDRPSAGIWQGAITYFYGSYWIYFSSNGQWFSKAKSPRGPWSAPVQVKTPQATGPLGYDNSIFVDDDGKPYMVIKNGQKVNRLQAIGKDGQLTDAVINLDWINGNLQYSWAEGPVMCKRNGYYYYFPAGDVSGGQYVLRATALTSDSTKWERLGKFFKPITDPKATFRSPNHIAAPVQLADGTWWTIGQSYQRNSEDDWSGMGRQTALYRVIWEGDRPWGVAPTSKPEERPNLPQSGLHWRAVLPDYFDGDSLGLPWHFLTRSAAANYSLIARKGWIRLTPQNGRTHVVQKETDHYYTAVTKVDFNAADTAAKAGIYLTSGNQKVNVRLFTTFNQQKEIVFALDTAVRVVPNKAGNTVWLKITRNWHTLSAYYSADGKNWMSVGSPIDARPLDKVQPNYNSWVGTSLGLFAEGKPADFDFFSCKDGESEIPAYGYSNYYGVETVEHLNQKTATNTSALGGWLMISGVNLGAVNSPSTGLQLTAAVSKDQKVEIWLDDITTKNGKLIAVAELKAKQTGSWQNISKAIKAVSGSHDVFIKFAAGKPGSLFIKSLKFDKK
ncbi:family 43 glycosylhydrolase [Mucilaginibacter sp. RS28]|uniref:Family 43 glycosylhydrolase n=1 Tax=Mucilaginibacter straminoryzae TaxID=2932774 RepID=A0A9X1WZR0_9SPHI|nr:family 43 glycosylhydrolase [Mucilaginibacter straminoryzae]MCJ8208612.1 family 43 glycosylhydrolase [Mucilaginibacter straminoryzae]